MRSALILVLMLGGIASRPDSAPVLVMMPPEMAEKFAGLTVEYPNLQIVRSGTREETLERIADCDALVGDVDEELLRAARRLRWVQSWYAGVEHMINTPGLRDRDIVVTNARIVMGPQLADHVFALLLTLTRNMRFYDDQMAKGGWDRQGGLPLLELHGKTMLILGLGGAGVQVAERAEAFGMRVLAVDPKDVPMTRAVAYCGKPDELHRLLPEADVVVSCAPATPQTVGMLGAAEFDQMKSGAFVINVSRGRIIDTEALTVALQAGKLGGAGLDVTHPEPLPAGHPLRSMPNVMLTPHIAGYSDGRVPRVEALIRENIGRFVRGLPLRNVVDKAAGY